MEAIQIRPAAASDLPQLMGLDHTSTTDRVWQLELRRDQRVPEVTAIFREVRLPRPVTLNYPNDPFALADVWKRKAFLWSAISGTHAVGYLGLVEPRAGVAWITDVVISPGFRRKGIASKLLEAAHEWCVEMGDHKIFFEMQSKNYPAIMLAQKHGYEFCGYNDRYYSSQDITLAFMRAI
jgi:ribosomal protein S18 acetylase RimI-like enzyme